MTLHLYDTEFICNTQHWVVAGVEMKAEFRPRRVFLAVMIGVEILEMTNIMNKFGKISVREAVSSLNRRGIKLECELCDIPMRMIFTGKHGSG